jgi:Ni,Fe-hydrogenase III small subunit
VLFIADSKMGGIMEKKTQWAGYLDEICYPVERYLPGFAVRDKEYLAGMRTEISRRQIINM